MNDQAFFAEFCDKTDEELVPLTLEDQAVFGCLMARYEQKLHRYIMRLSNIPETEADDILQEVFLKTYLNLNAFNPKMKFSSWIYRIAHNEAISQYRKRRARPEGSSLSLDETFINVLPDALDLQQEIDTRLSVEEILHAVDGLEMKYKEVFLLRYVEEKSYREISDIVRKPEGTVATLLHRACKQVINEQKT